VEISSQKPADGSDQLTGGMVMSLGREIVNFAGLSFV
jgi:hypothetical protein